MVQSGGDVDRTPPPAGEAHEPTAGAHTVARRALSAARGSLPAVFRFLFVGLLYYLVATAVLDAFMTHWAMGDNWRKSRFNKSIHYSVGRPFVYRVLAPWLINGVSEALPEEVAEGLAARTAAPRARYGLRQGNDTQYFVAYLLLLASLLGILLIWRALLSRIYTFPSAWADLAPPLVLLFYPTVFMQGGFIYDFPEVLVASAALFCFLRQRWPLFYALFVAAILNKETAVLMPVWFGAAYMVDRDRRRLLRHVGLSVAIGLVPLLAVRAYWADQPVTGGGESRLAHNLAFLSDLSSYWRGFDAYAAGLPTPQGFHALNLLFLAALLVLAWQRAPRRLWWIFVFTTLAILPLFLLFGWEDELRVFGLAFPALFLLLVWTLRDLYSGQPAGC